MHYAGGDDDDQKIPPVVSHEETGSPGVEGGQYMHPDGVPGDKVVNDSQLGG